MFIIGGVKPAGVPVAAVTGDIAHQFDGVIEVVILPQREHRGEFFTGEHIFLAHCLAHHHEEGDLFPTGDAGQFGDL